MQDLVDELDLRVVNALQVDPRAPWATVGRVLQVDPVTAARRWHRLSEAGLAWVTCLPGGSFRRGAQVAYLQADAPTAALDRTIARLAEEPRVYSVYHVTGTRPLLLGVAASGPGELSRYITERLATVPGLEVVSAHLVTNTHSSGAMWRLRSLSPQQRSELEAGRVGPSRSAPPRQLTDADRRLLAALAQDGRASYTDLAARADLSEPSARRRVNHLLASGEAMLRCDLAQAASGWPETVALWATVPPTRLSQVARSLTAIPEIRASFAVSGSHNLMLFAWLRDVARLPHLETLLSERCPELTIGRRAVALRTVKLMGRELAAGGRSARQVPIDFSPAGHHPDPARS